MSWFKAITGADRSAVAAIVHRDNTPSVEGSLNAFKLDAKAAPGTPESASAEKATAPAADPGGIFGNTQEVISKMNAFPLWKDVLSGPTHKGGLQVPTHLQEKLMAVQLTTGKVLLIYEATSLIEVKFRLAAMRNELESASIQVERQYTAVAAEVMRELRVSAEGRSRAANSDSVRSESVELLKRWVMQAKEIGATDLHCSIGAGNRGFVHVRVDGLLEQLPDSLSGLTDSTVLSVIKTAYETMADRNSNSDGSFSDRETRSCMIESGLGMANLRLRFTSQRGFFGPKAVMRLLTTSVDNEPKPFEAMGFSPSQLVLFEKAQRLTSGIILQTGVTGSGKTTAAKTLLETHPRNGQWAMIQVADPVEYVLKGVHQINVQRSLITLSEEGKKDPYSEVIESLMRMDPDAVDIGEIRDVISARAAANVAKTGHLVLGTLHTDGLEGTISRLTDPKIGLSREELTASRMLRLLTYQALLPLLCEHCCMDSKAKLEFHTRSGQDKEARYVQFVAKHFAGLGQDPERLRYRDPQGCTHCRNRGTAGLTIVAEMLMADDDQWLDLSAAGKDRAAWRYYRETYSDGDLTSGNMDGKTTMEHAIFKALMGAIDPTNIETFGSFDRYQPISPRREAFGQTAAQIVKALQA